MLLALTEQEDEFLTLLFALPENPKSGSIYNVDFSEDTNVERMGGESDTETPVEYENGTIELISDLSDNTISYGDIDGNSSVDITDLTMLSIHLVDKTVMEKTQEKAADVNGDGLVNLLDLAHLRQYLSKKVNWLGKEEL